jgi:predicted benzoate:H+ symporter BenE
MVFALVLLLAMALPLSSCSHYVDPDEKLVGFLGWGSAQADSRKVTSDAYVLSGFDAKELACWLLMASFLWPIPALVLQARRARWKLGRMVWWSEPALAIGSGAYIVSAASLFSRPAVGAFLACAALMGYLGVWLYEFRRWLRGLPGGNEPNRRMQASAGGSEVAESPRRDSARRA